MATRFKPYTVNAYGSSDIGLVRDNNEDAWIIEPEHNVYILADGMGGHSAGEVASQEAVYLFSNLLKRHLGKQNTLNSKEASLVIHDLIQDVNSHVHNLGQTNRGFKGMGTTLCSVYFHENKMVVSHVGDSRVYLLRAGKLTQLTADHSLVVELVELGELSQKQADAYAHRNIITKAIGTEPLVTPDIEEWEISIGDEILMCSDGLTDLFSNREIEKLLQEYGCIEQSVAHLIEAANIRGGKDNTTIILMKIREKDEKPNLPRS